MKEVVITSSILIICIVLFRQLSKGKISACLQYALWLAVAVRLIIPAADIIFPDLLPESEFSIMSVAKKVETGTQYYMQTPEKGGETVTGIGELPFVHAGNEGSDTAADSFAKPEFSWLDFFRTVWYAGMVIMGAWMAAANILFIHRLRKNRIRYEKEDYKLPIYYVKELSSPCLYGALGKQAVYMPEEVAEDGEKIKHILAHEYCHYKHKDVFWSGLRCILLVIYWFNPLVWIAAFLSKQDCELACDESAIKLLGDGERVAYGKTLLSLITKGSGASDIMCAATTMNGGKNSIKERIKLIAEKPHRLAMAFIPVFMVMGIVIAFTFTQAKEYPEGAHLLEGEGEQSVATDCFQIVFPEQLADRIYYLIENDTDVIIYHKDYDKEVGRFCMLNFEEAVLAADEGEITLIGDFGQNPKLKAYMNGEDYETSTSEHFYYTNTENAEDGSTLVGVPGTDSNDDTTYILNDEENIQRNTASESDGCSGAIPAPEDVDSEIINLPYSESHNYSPVEVTGADDAEAKHEYVPNKASNASDAGDAEAKHDYVPNQANSASAADDANYAPEEIGGTDIILLPDDAAILPDEKITTMSIPQAELCYVYIRADASDAKENVREELDKINQELVKLSESVTILSMSEKDMEEILDSLIEKRKIDEDNYVSVYAEIADILPVPSGLRYNMLQLDAGTEASSVTLHYRLLSDDMEKVGRNTLFMDAALLFSVSEGLEKCSFQMNEDVNKIKYSSGVPEDFLTETVTYERAMMEELFGPLYPQSATKEDFRTLYNTVLDYLNGNTQD